MFTPGLAIFYLATILRLSHVCSVQWSRVWRKSRFLVIATDNMHRASQLLAQGVPPGVPNSYRARADLGNVPRSTLHYYEQLMSRRYRPPNSRWLHNRNILRFRPLLIRPTIPEPQLPTTTPPPKPITL